MGQDGAGRRLEGPEGVEAVSIEEALQWCMDNGVELGFGTNPHDGAPTTSMRHGNITRDWEPGTPAEQIIRLVERAREDR